MREAFHRLDYSAARSLAGDILNDWQAYSPTELEETHKVLAVILYSEGNLPQAQQHFEQAIQLNSNAVLDSVYISPKIISYFNEIKSAYQPEKTQPTHVRYVLIPDPRPGAVVRSLFIPGWGQLHKGHLRKGIVLIGAATLSTAAFIGVTWHTQQKRDAYLNAETSLTIEENYRTYNTWYKRQQVTGYVMGVIWGVAIVDALLTEPCEPKRQLSVIPLADQERWALYLQYRF